MSSFGSHPAGKPARVGGAVHALVVQSRAACLAAAMGAVLFLSVFPAGAATWEEVVDRVQDRLDRVETFRARFQQLSRNRSLEATLVSRGRIVVKRPDKVLWEYQEPEVQLFVTKGDSFYVILSEDRQVLVADVDKVFRSKLPALFLSGRGRIADDFEAAVDSVKDPLPLDEQGLYRLVLRPRKPSPELARLTLGVESDNFVILRTEVVDGLGNEVSVILSDVQLNGEVSDEEFSFTIPPDFEIIDAESYLP